MFKKQVAYIKSIMIISLFISSNIFSSSQYRFRKYISDDYISSDEEDKPVKILKTKEDKKRCSRDLLDYLDKRKKNKTSADESSPDGGNVIDAQKTHRKLSDWIGAKCLHVPRITSGITTHSDAVNHEVYSQMHASSNHMDVVDKG